MELKKASHSFRKKLKDSLPEWQEQGFIAPEQVHAMTAYYQLDSLKSEITHLFVTGVYLIGVFLIGIGIISFIAAHWMSIDRSIKVVMLFAVMLSAHGTGYYLWQVSGRYPRLGHALVVLGTLIFGANIGLMAQIFHVSENPANGYLAWSLGAAAAAYALRSVPNALIAIVTSMIFFFVRFSEWAGGAPLWFPFAAAALFIPLAYLCRSRWVLMGILISLGLSIPFSFISAEGNMVSTLILPVFAAVCFTAWGLLNHSTEQTLSFAMPCKIAGFTMGFIFLYLLSFWELATELHDEYSKFLVNHWGVHLSAGVILSIALLLTVFTFTSAKTKSADKSNLILLALSALATVVLAGIDAYVLVVAVHLLMLLLSGNLIRMSIQTQSRGLFWAGIWLPGLIILSRTLEYETELLIKAIIFATCGVGVIAAGVLFERQLKRKGLAHV